MNVASCILLDQAAVAAVGMALFFEKTDISLTNMFLGCSTHGCLMAISNRSARLPGRILRYNRQYIEQLPIRPINFADPTDVARHDRMVALVEAMLDLHRKLAAAVTDQEKTVHQRQIVATDRQIDRLVYELYGLTEAEIGIVESTS